MSQSATRSSGAVAACRTTADYILYVLGRHGVEHIFLNPGTDTAPYQEGAARLAEAGIQIPRVIPCPYESVALAAAEGYWQATGRVQCVMVHVDVGTQNLGGMLHDAQRGHTGVLIIAGKAPYSEDARVPGARSNSIHWRQDEPDQIGIVRGYTKWAQELSRPHVAAQTVSRALQIARSAPAGPTYLMAARDVLMEPAQPAPDGRDDGYAVPAPPAVDKAALTVAVEALVSAERPVFVTSYLGRNPAAVPTLTQLVELLGARVFGRPEALNIRWSHPMYVRTETDGFRMLADADVVVIVDSDVPWIPASARPRPDAFVIQIDIDPVKADMPLWTYPVDLAISADESVALTQLLDAVTEKTTADPSLRERWAERGRSLTASAAGSLRPTDDRDLASFGSHPPSVGNVMAALNRVISDEDLVVEEAVTNAEGVHAHLRREQPGTYLVSGGPGLGWGLGAAVGAKLAKPDRNVIAVVGDGAFLFGVPSAAFTLAAEAAAPFMAVILDNGRYRASQRPVLQLFPDGVSARSGTVVGAHFARPPDFAKLAEACHAHGERVSDAAELPAAMTRAWKALDEGRSAVVDVVLDTAGAVG